MCGLCRQHHMHTQQPLLTDYEEEEEEQTLCLCVTEDASPVFLDD